MNFKNLNITDEGLCSLPLHEPSIKAPKLIGQIALNLLLPAAAVN